MAMSTSMERMDQETDAAGIPQTRSVRPLTLCEARRIGKIKVYCRDPSFRRAERFQMSPCVCDEDAVAAVIDRHGIDFVGAECAVTLSCSDDDPYLCVLVEVLQLLEDWQSADRHFSNALLVAHWEGRVNVVELLRSSGTAWHEERRSSTSEKILREVLKHRRYCRHADVLVRTMLHSEVESMAAHLLEEGFEIIAARFDDHVLESRAAARRDVLKCFFIVLSDVITDYIYYVDILSRTLKICDHGVVRKALQIGMVSHYRKRDSVDICQRLFNAAVRNGNSELVRIFLHLPQLSRYVNVSCVMDTKTCDSALHLACRMGSSLVRTTFDDDLYAKAVRPILFKKYKDEFVAPAIACRSDYYRFVAAASATLEPPAKGLDAWKLLAMSSEMEKLQLNVRFDSYVETAHLLIQHGADVNATNNDGETPLLVSAGQQLHCTGVLLEIYGLCPTYVFEQKLRWKRNCGLMAMAKSLHEQERNMQLDDRKVLFSCLVCDIFPPSTIDWLNPVVDSYFRSVNNLLGTLVQAGADANFITPHDRTALVIAADKASQCIEFCREMLCTTADEVIRGAENVGEFLRSNVFTVVRELLVHDADWRIGSQGGISVLDVAVYSNQTDLLVELICQGAELASWSEYLVLVFESEPHGVIEKTLASLSMLGVSVDTKDENGLTALHVAAERNLPEVVKKLIYFGGDVTVVDARGRTPFETAQEHGCSNAALAFQRHLPTNLMPPAVINAHDEEGHTALHVAARENDADKVRELLTSGADIGIVDEDGRTPLVTALIFSNWNAAYAIMDRGPDALSASKMDAIVDSEGSTLLHRLSAASPPRKAGTPLDILRRILGDGGISAKVTDFNGNTALHNFKQSPDICRLLVEHGAHVNAQNGLGQTPLHVVFRAGDVENVRCLMQRGADLEACDDFFNSPFHCDTSYYSKWKHLLSELPPSVIQSNALNVFGARTVFQMMAVDDTRPRLAQIDLAYRDHLGNTALHVAAGAYGHKFRNTRVMHFDDDKDEDLFSLSRKEDLSVRNSFGQTPLHLKWLELGFDLKTDDSFHQKDGLGRTSWHHMFIFTLSAIHAVEYVYGDGIITDMDIGRELEALRMFPIIPVGYQSKRCMLNIAGCNESDYSGRTPLHYAAMQTMRCHKCYVTGCYLYCKCCIFLFGVDSWTRKDKWGRTPLHYSYLIGQRLPQFIIDTLPVELTESGERQDDDGCTPQHMLDSYLQHMENENIAKGVEKSCFANFKRILQHCGTKEFFKDCTDPAKADERLRHLRKEKEGTLFVWDVWTQLPYAYRDPDHDAVHAAVLDFMSRLVKAIGEEDQRLKGVLHQVGSSFEGTRVGHPDEFDFNVELVNLNSVCDVVTSSECPNGFAHLVKKPGVDLSDGNYDQLFDQNGTLLATAVSFWFQSTWIKVLSWQKFWDAEPLFEVKGLSSLYRLPPNKLVKEIMLSFNRPVNGKLLHYTVSIDIVPVVRIESWWPDDAIPVSQNIRTLGCNFVFDQPRRKHGATHSKKPFVRISFARAESMSIRDSAPVVRAAYMVAKHITSHNVGETRDIKVSSHTLKIAALWSAKDTNPPPGEGVGSSEHLYGEIEPHQLQRQVEALFRRLWEFCTQDYVPSFFLPSVRVAVWSFELFPKYSHTLLRRTFSDYRQLFLAGVEPSRHVALHDIRQTRNKMRNALAYGFALLYVVSDSTCLSTDWMFPAISDND